MQVEQMSMDPRIARIHYLDYRKKVREHRDERKKELDEIGADAGRELGRIRTAKSRLEQEDEALMKAYRQLSLGQRIIDLRSVMHAAGVDKRQYFPRLAIVRSDCRTCHFSHQWGRIWQNSAAFYDETVSTWSTRHRSKVITFPPGTFPAETSNNGWRASSKLMTYPVSTVVPRVPPHLRPSNPHGYYILWEVENWEKSGPPVAPEDPLLLKRVSRHFYTIVAQWDLTPLEQRVIEGSL